MTPSTSNWVKIPHSTTTTAHIDVYVADDPEGVWLMNGDDLEATFVSIAHLRPVIDVLWKKWRREREAQMNRGQIVDDDDEPST